MLWWLGLLRRTPIVRQSDRKGLVTRKDQQFSGWFATTTVESDLSTFKTSSPLLRRRFNKGLPYTVFVKTKLNPTLPLYLDTGRKRTGRGGTFVFHGRKTGTPGRHYGPSGPTKTGPRILTQTTEPFYRFSLRSSVF